MKLFIVGSSLVDKLGQFDTEWKHTLRCGRVVDFEYYGSSGWSFENFLSEKGLTKLDRILAKKPDMVLAILGANSIKTTVDPRTIMHQASRFYQTLNTKFLAINPKGIIIASQLPLRFVRGPRNKHNTPDPHTFSKIRNKINTKIVSLKTKHHTLAIGGPGRLDQEAWFEDGVHFTQEGLAFQLDIILQKLHRILNPDTNKPRGTRRSR